MQNVQAKYRTDLDGWTDRWTDGSLSGLCPAMASVVPFVGLVFLVSPGPRFCCFHYTHVLTCSQSTFVMR